MTVLDTISRRGFLKATAVAGTALAISTNVIGGGNGLLIGHKTAHAQSGQEVRLSQCTTGGLTYVYVRDGRIVRTEPLWFSQQEAQAGKFPWKVQVGTKTYSPPLRVPRSVWGTAAKSYVYSPTRGKYPMKRVDWDPSGNRHPENRGKSDYVRISWDEALTYIANEMKRVGDTYGRSAIMVSSSGHNEWGSVHYSTSAHSRFWNLTGGFTTKTSVPVSWQGWTYGASFMWGYYWANGVVTEADVFTDVMQNSKQIVVWAIDNLTIGAMYMGSLFAVQWPWFKELGKKVIVINPSFPFTGFFADKWIPVIPGTDEALAAAIAYVWIKDGTYDQNYLDTHTIGFDSKTLPAGAPANSDFKSYILGTQDGIPKTPEWAEQITTVKARQIRVLARDWAANPTSLLVLFAGACRKAYDYEWARMMVTLQAMQGLGKPGVNIYSGKRGVPYDTTASGFSGYADGGMNAVANKRYGNPVTQTITDVYMDRAFSNPPVSWTGGGSLASLDSAFTKWTYPMPGYSEIHMMYQFGSSNFHVKGNCTTYTKIYQSPKMEFVAVQAPWFETDAMYSDIYLPANTPFERSDASEPGKPGSTADPSEFIGRSCVYQHKCIDSLWESKSDLDIYTALADKVGVKDAFTEGNSEEDWIKKLFAKANIPMTYDDFKAKGYYVYPIPDDYMTRVFNPQLTWFYKKPQIATPADGLSTPTGKIEIFSTKIFANYGFEDLKKGIAAIPKYRESYEGRNTHPLVDKYPLQLLTVHPRFRYHGKYDQLPWLRQLYKVKGSDGKEYEPIFMNQNDAAARGLKDSDIVRVFNDRGSTLCGVQITQRTTPGVVLQSYGAWNDPVQKGTYGVLDRSGNANVIAPDAPPDGKQDHECGYPFNSLLVQVEKWGGLT